MDLKKEVDALKGMVARLQAQLETQQKRLTRLEGARAKKEDEEKTPLLPVRSSPPMPAPASSTALVLSHPPPAQDWSERIVKIEKILSEGRVESKTRADTRFRLSFRKIIEKEMGLNEFGEQEVKIKSRLNPALILATKIQGVVYVRILSARRVILQLA